ncbi:MAG: C25 family cysteine peptidase, partial [Leadbetterella sp.]
MISLKNSLVFFSILIFSKSLRCQNTFANDWIEYDKEYLIFTIKQKGIYRISYSDLLLSQFDVSNKNPTLLELYHHGKAVPIRIEGEADSKFDPDDYIEFYAEENLGEQDTELYRPTNSRMNPYHSLYSDETRYFLTLKKSPGLRMKQILTTPNPQKVVEPFHLETQVWAFTDQYSFNNSLGYPPNVMQSFYEEGEGWTGKVIMRDSIARFRIKLENYVHQNGIQPTIECLVNGRTEKLHDIGIAIEGKNNLNRELGAIRYFGFKPLRISSEVKKEEIQNDDSFVLRSQSSLKENTEWHSWTYIKTTYPQAWDMGTKSEKSFNLPKKDIGFAQISSLKSGAQFFQIDSRYSVSKLLPTELVSPIIKFENSTPESKLWVSNIILKPLKIEKSVMRKLEGQDNTFLIITHPDLLPAAKEYAQYRQSKEGGAYPVDIVSILDLYNQFSYGERTPLAIRRYLDYRISSQKTNPSYLFIIGRGMSFPDNLKSQAPLDLVPTMGYPGSDVLLSSGLNGYDMDVQSIPTGRLSVNNIQQATAYLQKVKEFEAISNQTLWKKNLLHLSGGLSTQEIINLQTMLSSIQNKAENGVSNAKITSLTKQTLNPVENIDISSEVNQGLGMITFVGHSSSTSTDLNIGYVSSATSKVANQGKYPFMFFNGCGVGNIFNRYELLTTDWLLSPNKGGIAVLANSFWSYDFPTSRYLKVLYEMMFEDPQTAGEPIGKIHQAVNKKIKAEGVENYMLANIHQLVFQGDPSLTIFPFTKPDFTAEHLLIESKNFSKNIGKNDSIRIGVITSNQGRYDRTLILPLELKKDGQRLGIFRSKNVGYRDTLYFTIKNDSLATSFEARIDPDNTISEYEESNNFARLNLDWQKAKNYNSYPFNKDQDKLGPQIDVFIDKRRLKKNDWVASNASIRFTIQDENPLKPDINLVEVQYA